MPTLTNWNDEIRFDVADDQFKTPTQVSDVQAIVRHAFERNQPVTVVGALHSTTECMVGAGIIISMKNMSRVLSVDPDRLTVTVEGGVSLHQLCSHLKELGLQPPVILEFGNFQIGAVSGTHANDTSMTRGAQFSSFVLGVKLVTPTGDVMGISETENAEYLPAIRSHFGMFGVVCEVTLRVFKNQPLQVSFQTAKVNSFLDGFTGKLQALKAAYDQVFGMLFPHTGILLWQCRKFLEPVTPSPLSPVTWTNPIASEGVNLFEDVLLPLVKVGTAVHSSAAIAELLSAALIELPLKIMRHSSYVIDPCDRGIIYGEHAPGFEFYDWMFPEEKWCDMVRAFLQLSDRFRRERDFALPLPALIYFVKQDQASLLSRSRHANMIAIDPLYPNPKNPTWKAFRVAFNDIAVKHGGIPHINKTRDGAISHFAKVQDPESIRLYLQKRKQLDPKDLFLNDFFKTMFAEYL
ncbi:hypothetical protein H2201_004262 [Coniosporium apollinis]|uniref:D-arabinono-1,4-lactone oxidase n=2 Tax=Coniosporium TaxID=2810619 RepID=A0ABQ9NX19_9PEZI|nr:hypothetical protein H2199_000029 [Cladosporium sp. JES 115]KAJ9665571.1 hypothetical protein H2201_004262 [Coniosporium apollinis]